MSMALRKKQGPILTSVQGSDVNAIPGKWIAKLGKTVTTRQSPTDVGITTPTTTVIESKVDQSRTDERLKVDTSLGNYSGQTLVDYRVDAEAGRSLPRTESLVPAGTVTGGVIDGSGDVTEIISTGTPLDIKVVNRVSYEGLIPGGPSKTGYEYDAASGKVVPVVTSIIATGSEVPTGVQSDGTYVSIRAINPTWSVKTVRYATAITTRSYTQWERITSLPRVLTTFSGVTFLSRTHRIPFGDEPSHTDRNYITPSYIVMAGINTVLTDFNKEYLVTVTEMWSKDAHTLDGMTVFAPTGFSWITPFNSGSVPECLHDAVTISYSTGTNHPTLAYATGNYYFAATTPTTISGTIVIADSQVPAYGGWLRTKKTISV